MEKAIFQQMAEQEGVSEKLKAVNHLERIARRNNIFLKTTEIENNM